MNFTALLNKLEDILRLTREIRRDTSRLLAKQPDSRHQKEEHQLSQISEPRQDNKESVGYKGDASNKDESTFGQKASPSNIKEAPRLRDTPNNKWYRSIQWWKSVLELIAIPFAIFYAVVTYFQWQDARHHFTTDERAWLQITHPNYNEDIRAMFARGKMLITLKIANVGKTPAMNMRIKTAIQIIDTTTEPTLEYPKDLTRQITIKILFAGESESFNGGSDQAISEDDRKRVIDKMSYMVFYGVVDYFDIFGVEHETRYCDWSGYLGPNGIGTVTAAANKCSQYNYADTR